MVFFLRPAYLCEKNIGEAFEHRLFLGSKRRQFASDWGSSTRWTQMDES